MKKETLVCDQCGNSNLKKQDKNSYICKCCGATIRIVDEALIVDDNITDNSELNGTLIKIASGESLIKAIAHYREIRNKSLKESKNYVEQLCAARGVIPKKKKFLF